MSTSAPASGTPSSCQGKPRLRQVNRELFAVHRVIRVLEKDRLEVEEPDGPTFGPLAYHTVVVLRVEYFPAISARMQPVSVKTTCVSRNSLTTLRCTSLTRAVLVNQFNSLKWIRTPY